MQLDKGAGKKQQGLVTGAWAPWESVHPCAPRWVSPAVAHRAVAPVARRSAEVMGFPLKPGVSFIGISPVLVCVLCARARARMDSHSSSRALRFASAVCDKAAHRGFFMPHCGRYTTKGRELLPLRVSMVANIAQITAHRCPVLHQCQCCPVGSSARVREWGRAGPRRVRFISHTQ